MGFFRRLKTLKIGRLVKAGAGLALAGVPGASFAEKVLSLKARAGDRKQELLAARIAKGEQNRQIGRSLTGLKTPVVSTRKPTNTLRPGLLSAPAISLASVSSVASAEGKRTLAARGSVQKSISTKKKVEKKTKGYALEDWQDLAARYKASGSKLSWEDWLNSVL